MGGRLMVSFVEFRRSSDQISGLELANEYESI